MKIATFNINGIKARIEALPAWLAAANPDVVCLQEIKSVDEAFPREVFESMGYRVETHGQKGFNGVAILSKLPLEDVTRGLPGLHVPSVRRVFGQEGRRYVLLQTTGGAADARLLAEQLGATVVTP